MRLALDAMGGDDAPAAMVAGAIDYAQQFPQHEVVLVGQQTAIEASLQQQGLQLPSQVSIHDAPDVISMADKISALKEKPNDSMAACAKLVKAGDADGMILCGNTACSVAVAQLHLRRIKGVARAGILTPLPNVGSSGHTWVVDCGANAVGKAEHLVQWADIATTFLQAYRQLDAPSVGVLNIGSEDGKGTELTNETLAQLRETSLNVAGNIEGNDIYKGTVDIVVCDGFTGNVLLKASEGIASAIGQILKEEIKRGFWTKIGGLLSKPAFKRLKNRIDWSKVGGCLLVGVDGITVIGHGRSDRVAVFHALKQAATCAERDVMNTLRQKFAA